MNKPATIETPKLSADERDICKVSLKHTLIWRLCTMLRQKNILCTYDDQTIKLFQ